MSCTIVVNIEFCLRARSPAYFFVASYNIKKKLISWLVVAVCKVLFSSNTRALSYSLEMRLRALSTLTLSILKKLLLHGLNFKTFEFHNSRNGKYIPVIYLWFSDFAAFSRVFLRDISGHCDSIFGVKLRRFDLDIIFR